jgi:hypothetical protein
MDQDNLGFWKNKTKKLKLASPGQGKETWTFK